MKIELCKSRRGADLAIAGQLPSGAECQSVTATTAAVIGTDYPGLKPRVLVQVGDKVIRGQAIIEDKSRVGLNICAPVAGEVTEINRGDKRKLESIAIQADPLGDAVKITPLKLGKLKADECRQMLVDSGLWCNLRQRPYDSIPAVDAEPTAIFVSVMDSSPIPMNVCDVLATNVQGHTRQELLLAGLKVLQAVAPEAHCYVCHHQNFAPDYVDTLAQEQNLTIVEMQGAHPSNNIGTAIANYCVPTATDSVWSIGFQQLIAIGEMALLGVYPQYQCYALVGPAIDQPALVETYPGVDVLEIAQQDIAKFSGDQQPPRRVVAGHLLFGHRAVDSMRFASRYHDQISFAPEAQTWWAMGWAQPGGDRYSVLPAFLGHFLAKFSNKKFVIETNRNGAPRGLVPIEIYEDNWPLPLPAIALIRALLISDDQKFQELHGLCLAPEDLALMTFVCPSKYDYVGMTRAMLDRIEKDG